MQKYSSRSENETIEIAQKIAHTVKKPLIFCLKGDLGAGKSVFARSFIRTLTDDQALDVPSPTFTLVQTYDAKPHEIWHFDLYRLQDPEEVYELGWEEAIGHAIMLIEWPERLGRLLPKNAITIAITTEDDESRTIEINHDF